LSLMAVWFLIGETHRGQQFTPALTLPQVRYGLSVLLLAVFYTPGVDSICRQVQRQLRVCPTFYTWSFSPGCAAHDAHHDSRTPCCNAHPAF